MDVKQNKKDKQKRKYYWINMGMVFFVFLLFVLVQWFTDNETYIMAGGARRNLELVSTETVEFHSKFLNRRGSLIGPLVIKSVKQLYLKRLPRTCI